MNDTCSQTYGELVSCLSLLTEDNVFQPYLTQKVFRRENHKNEIGYVLYIFDIRCHQKYSNPQPIKVQFRHFEVFSQKK